MGRGGGEECRHFDPSTKRPCVHCLCCDDKESQTMISVRLQQIHVNAHKTSSSRQALFSSFKYRSEVLDKQGQWRLAWRQVPPPQVDCSSLSWEANYRRHKELGFVIRFDCSRLLTKSLRRACTLVFICCIKNNLPRERLFSTSLPSLLLSDGLFPFPPFSSSSCETIEKDLAVNIYCAIQLGR